MRLPNEDSASLILNRGVMTTPVFRSALLLSLILILLAVGLRAQAPPERNAAAVLALSAEAQGLANRPATVRLQGRLTDNEGSERAFEMIAAGPARYLTRVSGKDYEYSFIRNGDSTTATLNGREMPVSTITTKLDRCPYLPLYGHFDEIVSGKLSPELATGTALRQVVLFRSDDPLLARMQNRFAKQFTGKIELNKTSFLPERLEVYSFHHGNPTHNAAVSHSYKKYQRKNGMMIPHHIEVRMNQQLTAVIEIDAVEFDVPIPSELSEVAQ
jgi:hypothetical protein